MSDYRMLTFTPREGRAIVWEDNPDWKKIESEITDQSRWSIHHSGVFLHVPTGKHYSINWSVGATEYQEERPFENDTEAEAYEVESVEVTVRQWCPVKDN